MMLIIRTKDKWDSLYNFYAMLARLLGYGKDTPEAHDAVEFRMFPGGSEIRLERVLSADDVGMFGRGSLECDDLASKSWT